MAGETELAVQVGKHEAALVALDGRFDTMEGRFASFQRSIETSISGLRTDITEARHPGPDLKTVAAWVAVIVIVIVALGGALQMSWRSDQIRIEKEIAALRDAQLSDAYETGKTDARADGFAHDIAANDKSSINREEKLDARIAPIEAWSRTHATKSSQINATQKAEIEELRRQIVELRREDRRLQLQIDRDLEGHVVLQ